MTSRIDPARMEALAELARLRLTAQERTRFLGDLDAILTYLGRIEDLSVEQNEPARETPPGQSGLREDRVAPSLAVEHVLRSMPRHRGGFAVVPRIIEE
jgi:aspartyl-tRNA(Asn)/glutamyl-tRNA(Gln) amidotransferase subunit C